MSNIKELYGILNKTLNFQTPTSRIKNTSKTSLFLTPCNYTITRVQHHLEGSLGGYLHYLPVTASAVEAPLLYASVGFRRCLACLYSRDEQPRPFYSVSWVEGWVGHAPSHNHCLLGANCKQLA